MNPKSEGEKGYACSIPTSLIALLGAISLLAASAVASAEPASNQKTSYAMSASTWKMEPAIPSMGGQAAAAKFARYEGMPTGTMTLNEGVATSKTARFSAGAIDFDIKPLGYNEQRPVRIFPLTDPPAATAFDSSDRFPFQLRYSLVRANPGGVGRAVLRG